MSFTKITSEDLADKGVVGLPDTPNLSVTALQKKFDEIATDVIVPKFNGLVDELDSFEETVDVAERVKSSEITDIRTDEDENLQISRDHGVTWSATASSGHIIEDGNATPYPSRGRLQFSANVNISDLPADNTTFIQVASGEKGDPGDDATITVGTVTSSGTDVSVTNVGSPTDAIFDFVLPKGDNGQAATIQVGTVTSGASASVSNRGTSSSAIFDFVLPKGDKGDAGTSFKVLGMYATYADLIAAHPTGAKGDAYAVGDSTLNVIYNWNNDTHVWDNLGSLQGAKGDDGDAATLTIGTVTTLEPDQSAYAINDGTTTNAILSLGLPKGVKGDQGNAATIAVGTVTRGEVPSVTNVGTPTNAIFDMVLPKGDKGDPTTVNGKSGETIQINGADILLTGYRDNVLGEVTSSDTVNQAISKLVNNSGGAKIIVSADSESVGNTMTCVKGTSTYTTTVGADEKATFTVNDIGTWTIKNLQTERETSVNIPYFGVYNVALGIGDVIINVIYDVEYVGATFTISYDGHTKTFVADGTLEKSIVMADYTTYTITNTYDDKTKTLTVTEGGEYEVAFTISAFDYQGWLDSASITTSFSSLDEVLADEKTLRILFTKHASVDYLGGWVENDETTGTTILNTDLVAKWINLRDYALDTLYANTTIKAIMDSADKYFYGEWVQTDGVWGAKGNVPIMTSNSAPYGEASGSTIYSGSNYYYAFDGNSSNQWKSNVATTSSGQYLQYKFVSPICVNKLLLTSGTSVNETWNFKLSASNDGTDFSHTVGTFSHTWSTTANEDITPTFDNTDYYLYYRVEWVSCTSSNRPNATTLQFYGRELSVSVPTMTSNTVPWGECIGSGKWDSSLDFYNAFGNNSAKQWESASGQGIGTAYLGYDFGTEVCVRAVSMASASTDSSEFVKKYKVQGLNASNVWEDVSTELTNPDNTANKMHTQTFNNTKAYSKYRVMPTEVFNTNLWVQIGKLQFYGLDYSEHAERHYIYDNGVTEETYTKLLEGNSVINSTSYSIHAEKNSETSSASVGYLFDFDTKFDLTPYTKAVFIADGNADYSTGFTNNKTLDDANSTSSRLAFKNGAVDKSYYLNAIDITNVNKSAYWYFGSWYTSGINVVDIREMWFE